MKYLKKSLKIIFIFLLLLVITGLSFMGFDNLSTSYLKIDKRVGENKDTYIINNVNIIPMIRDTVLMHKSILIKNGIIENISDSMIANDTEVIDGHNRYLSPGLIDMHVHVWDKPELGLYLSNGVTAVRNLWGMPMHLRIKELINDDELYGPHFFVSSPKLTGPNDIGDDKVQVSSVSEGKELVMRYKKRGYDFIKTYAGMPKDIMDGIIEQSTASDISIAIHPSFEIPYADQFHSQIATFEHAEDIVQQALEYKLDSTNLENVIGYFVRTNTSFTPTLTGYYKIYEMLDQGENIMESQEISYMNPLLRKVDSEAQFSRWQGEKENNPSITNYIYQQHKFHQYVLKRMNDLGVNIVCGTDAGIGITVPGYSIHEELELYREAGLSNYEVLKTATINPGNAHKEFNEMGSIEVGKIANFVLTDQNPLEDLTTLSQPEWVVVKGKCSGKKSLMNLLSRLLTEVTWWQQPFVMQSTYL